MTFVHTASGQSQHVAGYVDVEMKYDGKERAIRLYIIPTLTQRLYLGIDFWRRFELIPKSILLEVASITPEPETNQHAIDSATREQLDTIVAQLPQCTTGQLGKTTILVHKIDTGDAAPVKQRHYPISPAIQELMFAELDRMLESGVIEESQSPWNSPVSLVRKANGKVRLCLDARALNNVTIKDAYPMPIIEGILSRLDQTHYISSIDLKDAFWQVPLTDESKEKTAFSVPGRPHYQFTRMPFGLCNSAQTMCRLMDRVIPSHLRDHVFVYIDDLLVVSNDLDTHFSRLRVVAESLKRANLTINVAKSKFLMRSIRYLGHIVGAGTIRPDPERVRAIEEYPPPSTIKQIRRFLGMAGWYMRYIANYAAITAPITDLLAGKKSFHWTETAQKAFDEVKRRLSTAPVLTHPDFRRPFFIQCDASQSGIGSVLFQAADDGNDRPIAFMSRKLKAAERNYSVTELECLAAVCSVKRFRGYVEGMQFTIITDHASLKWLMGQRDLAGRLARWSLKLQGFNFTIEHRKGTANIVPDALSRAAIDEIDNEPMANLHVNLADAAFESPEHVALKEALADGGPSPDVKLSDGRVYKRVAAEDSVSDEGLCWRLWVPEGIRSRLLKDAHTPPMAAHGGVGKTLERLRRTVYWPEMSNDVRRYVASCDLCKQTKAPNVTLRPPMGRQIVAERPFQRIYTDLLGPYPRSLKASTPTMASSIDRKSSRTC